MANSLAVKGAAYESEALDSNNPSSSMLCSKIYTSLNLLTVTHNLCNQQAIKIMKNDGYRKEANFLFANIDHLNSGAKWADDDCKSFTHYYNPVGMRGYFNCCTSAVEECIKYYDLAKTWMIKQRFDRACFYLGAAAHLVQDLCVPHHSHNVMFSGHQRFEKWVEAHAENYIVSKHGLYDNSIKDPGEWVIKNAKASYDLYPFTKTTSFRDCHLATKAMFPHAQRTSAGFFLAFLESACQSEKLSDALPDYLYNQPQTGGITVACCSV